MTVFDPTMSLRQIKCAPVGCNPRQNCADVETRLVGADKEGQLDFACNREGRREAGSNRPVHPCGHRVPTAPACRPVQRCGPRAPVRGARDRERLRRRSAVMAVLHSTGLTLSWRQGRRLTDKGRVAPAGAKRRRNAKSWRSSQRAARGGSDRHRCRYLSESGQTKRLAARRYYPSLLGRNGAGMTAPGHVRPGSDDQLLRLARPRAGLAVDA